ncbi:hypothetical protein HDK64DRAFT_30071 [Phyllosticta capitalensis]
MAPKKKLRKSRRKLAKGSHAPAQDDVAKAKSLHQDEQCSTEDSSKHRMKLDLLPAEILCEIDDHLDNGSALAARVTCRRLREILTSRNARTEAINIPGAREVVRKQLVKDAIEAERKGRQHSGSMHACYLCDAFHPKSSFSEYWLRLSHRYCLGHSRRIQYCDHQWKNWHHLKPRGMRYSSSICLQCHIHMFTSPRDDGKMDCCIIEQCTGPAKSELVEGHPEWVTDRVNQTYDMLVGWVNAKICPHLCLENLDLREIASKLFQGLQSSCRVVRGTCASKHCCVNWKISLREQYRACKGMEVEVALERYFILPEMCSPEWLAISEGT